VQLAGKGSVTAVYRMISGPSQLRLNQSDKNFDYKIIAVLRPVVNDYDAKKATESCQMMTEGGACKAR